MNAAAKSGEDTDDREHGSFARPVNVLRSNAGDAAQYMPQWNRAAIFSVSGALGPSGLPAPNPPAAVSARPLHSRAHGTDRRSTLA